MKTIRTTTTVLLLTAALAIGAPTQAAEAPATIELPPNVAFSEYLESCCSKCAEAAEKLCSGGKVKNFSCGGFPCECSFDCDNGRVTALTLAIEAGA